MFIKDSSEWYLHPINIPGTGKEGRQCRQLSMLTHPFERFGERYCWGLGPWSAKNDLQLYICFKLLSFNIQLIRKCRMQYCWCSSSFHHKTHQVFFKNNVRLSHFSGHHNFRSSHWLMVLVLERAHDLSKRGTVFSNGRTWWCFTSMSSEPGVSCTWATVLQCRYSKLHTMWSLALEELTTIIFFPFKEQLSSWSFGINSGVSVLLFQPPNMPEWYLHSPFLKNAAF